MHLVGFITNYIVPSNFLESLPDAIKLKNTPKKYILR